MSVLIKSVEMPSKCWSCPCRVDNGLIGSDREYFCSALRFPDFEIDNLEQRLSACPLKEVPTLHGRLIDADRLMEVIEKNSYLLKGYYNSLENGMFLTGIKQAINEAPTIIEAEVSE